MNENQVKIAMTVIERPLNSMLSKIKPEKDYSMKRKYRANNQTSKQ